MKTVRPLSHPRLAFTLFAIAVAPALAYADSPDAHWPEWRGPSATGAAASGNPPIEWSETRNVRWRVKIGGLGSSTPTIWDERVYLTTAVDTGMKAPKGADSRPDSERQANPGGSPPAEI